MRITRTRFRALLGAALMFGAFPAFAQITISVDIPPPALPVYEQPDIPGPDYLWTPGYWAYDDEDGYYWFLELGLAAPGRPALDARVLGLE